MENSCYKDSTYSTPCANNSDIEYFTPHYDDHAIDMNNRSIIWKIMKLG